MKSETDAPTLCQIRVQFDHLARRIRPAGPHEPPAIAKYRMDLDALDRLLRAHEQAGCVTK